MTKDEDRTILLIGSGPIQIGQAAEFDYSGRTGVSCPAGRGRTRRSGELEPGDDHDRPPMADKVYLEPINTEAISEIIRKGGPGRRHRRPGGQTGLNVTAELAEEGVLEEYDVDVMGTPLDTIYATEDRDLFRQRMQNIGEPVARSTTISLDEDESVTDFDEGRRSAGASKTPSTKSADSPSSRARPTPSAGPGRASSTTWTNSSSASARACASRATAKSWSPNPSPAGSNWSTK